MPTAFPSPECDCKKDRQTSTHIIMHCELYNEERLTLISSVIKAYRLHNVPTHKWDLDVQTFIAPNFSAPVNHSIHKAMVSYIGVFRYTPLVLKFDTRLDLT